MRREVPAFATFPEEFMATCARSNNKRSEQEEKDRLLRLHLNPATCLSTRSACVASPGFARLHLISEDDSYRYPPCARRGRSRTDTDQEATP